MLKTILKFSSLAMLVHKSRFIPLFVCVGVAGGSNPFLSGSHKYICTGIPDRHPLLALLDLEEISVPSC